MLKFSKEGEETLSSMIKKLSQSKLRQKYPDTKSQMSSVKFNSMKAILSNPLIKIPKVKGKRMALLVALEEKKITC